MEKAIKCPYCKSKRIDTTLNFNDTDPNKLNCKCLECGHTFNHKWAKSL